jgi:hypothetical protein
MNKAELLREVADCLCVNASGSLDMQSIERLRSRAAALETPARDAGRGAWPLAPLKPDETDYLRKVSAPTEPPPPASKKGAPFQADAFIRARCDLLPSLSAEHQHLAREMVRLAYTAGQRDAGVQVPEVTDAEIEAAGIAYIGRERWEAADDYEDRRAWKAVIREGLARALEASRAHLTQTREG